MEYHQEYIYMRADWPAFRWNSEKINTLLFEVRYRQGKLLGGMENLGFKLRDEAILNNLTLEVIKTSEIEGEILDVDQVRSSVAKKLGIEISGLPQADRNVDGVVDMMYDATNRYEISLSKERLFKWHQLLFPEGYSGLSRIKTGQWRDDKTGPMQVVSGPIGREKIHFEAPSASVIEHEINRFLNWFNEEEKVDQLLKASLAHLWFVTIHPFADGNGRITRAITDMTLARSDSTIHRYYSMSSQIRKDRNNYYKILERTQKGDMDVTEWIVWFLECLKSAIDESSKTLVKIINKSHFWEYILGTPINVRQARIINMLLDHFEGKLTTSKWAKINKCSQDTAYRDILDLIDKRILVKNPGEGRNTSYSLMAI